jgi:hypothetical protein
VVGQGRHGHRRPAWVKTVRAPTLAEPPRSPDDQRGARLGQIATLVGQLVHLAGGGRRKFAPCQDAVALKRTQAIGQERATDSRQAVDEVAESPGARHELPNDQQRPSVAGDVQCARESAVLLITVLGHSSFLELQDITP